MNVFEYFDKHPESVFPLIITVIVVLAVALAIIGGLVYLVLAKVKKLGPIEMNGNEEGSVTLNKDLLDTIYDRIFAYADYAVSLTKFESTNGNQADDHAKMQARRTAQSHINLLIAAKNDMLSATRPIGDDSGDDNTFEIIAKYKFGNALLEQLMTIYEINHLSEMTDTDFGLKMEQNFADCVKMQRAIFEGEWRIQFFSYQDFERYLVNHENEIRSNFMGLMGIFRTQSNARLEVEEKIAEAKAAAKKSIRENGRLPDDCSFA